MKIAVIYNRESQKVINLFGMPNREKYGIKAIGRITDALQRGGHQVIALEGDKDLIDKLEEFMPRVLTSFVRNKLIDEVYLPIIGDNLAKQIGTAGENKRTDSMIVRRRKKKK